IIDAGRTLGDRKKRLTIISLNPYDEYIFLFPPDGSGIERCVDAKPFHKIRIGIPREIVAPENRCMLCRKHWISITFKDSIAMLNRLNFSIVQLLVVVLHAPIQR